ncbi:MAG: TonB-dependent receptor plug domain-containing protein [Bacteroidota bacterium]
MNLFKINSSILFFCMAFSGYSQISVDSTQQLTAVEITDSKLKHFAAGTKVETVDSATLQRFSTYNLADLLSAQNRIFVKSYGLGSLSTSSSRGGNANHTAVLWNGFNLNSPMNGVLDLALVPVNFSNEINIQYSGTSALWGSGAVAGVIHLNNKAEYNKGLTFSAGATVGSFNNYAQQAAIGWSGKRFVTSLKLFNHTAQNHYPYYNTYLEETPKKYQNNNELKQSGLLTENYFKINSHQKINLRFWYQFNDRNIPPTMLQLTNRSYQKDETYRITSEWQRTGEKLIWIIRAAYFDEDLKYTDEISHKSSMSHSQNSIVETETRITLSRNHFINLGLNNTFVKAKSFIVPTPKDVSGYNGTPRQNRTSLFFSYKYQSANNKLNVVISAREEMIENKMVPFTYSGGIDWRIMKWVSVKANVSKVYRIPTFNDLYWIPGGNPNLLSESGYCEEGGLQFNWNNKKWTLLFQPTLFNRRIENWVIWLPESYYWSPKNIMEVWSRGMETRTEIQYTLGKLKIKTEVTTNYVVSTSEKAKSANDASVGKQLIYVPMYSGQGLFSVEYKGFVLSYQQTYTGYRYTSTDNREYLKPYQLSSIYLFKKITNKNYAYTVFVNVNNLFNERYEVIQSRAMPLVNYQAGISLQYNEHK